MRYAIFALSLMLLLAGCTSTT
ncbi:MAG: lipoprotein, partial [Candidatus Micrarchaeota archaeon]